MKTERYYTIWNLDIPNRKSKPVYTASENWHSCRVSPNKKYYLVFQPSEKTFTEGKYFLLTTDTFTRIDLGDGLESQKYIFHPKEPSVVSVVQDKNKTKSDLVEYNFQTKQTKVMVTEPGEIRSISYSPTGDKIVYIVNPDSYKQTMFIINTDRTKSHASKRKIVSLNILAVILPSPETSLFAWSSDGKQLALNLLAAGADMEMKTYLYLVNLK